MSRMLRTILVLLVSLAFAGCSTPTQRLLAPTSPSIETAQLLAPPEGIEQGPRLSLAVEATPRVILWGQPTAVVVNMYLTNREHETVTLFGCMELLIRGIHGPPPQQWGCVPATIVLAPGQTLRKQLEIPGDFDLPDTYHFTAVLHPYDYTSPPFVVRIVRN
jgi:hypothetical protein